MRLLDSFTVVDNRLPPHRGGLGWGFISIMYSSVERKPDCRFWSAPWRVRGGGQNRQSGLRPTDVQIHAIKQI